MQIINEFYLKDSVIENLFMVYYSKVDNSKSAEQEYKDKSLTNTKLIDDLMEKLSDEEKKEFDNVLNSIYDLNFSMNKGFFKEGFIQGSKMMQEIYPTNTKK